MIEEKKPIKKSQNIVLENRQRANITGVLDVESFNDETIIVETELGILIIKGEDLHINKLNLENSQLDIEGEIDSVEYSDKESSRGMGFFGRMFK